jgi:hypothetical protein
MNKGAVENSNWVSFMPSYPLILLPIEKSSPDLESISVWDYPHDTLLIQILKLRFLGTLKKLYQLW